MSFQCKDKNHSDDKSFKFQNRGVLQRALLSKKKECVNPISLLFLQFLDGNFRLNYVFTLRRPFFRTKKNLKKVKKKVELPHAIFTCNLS